MAKKKYQKESIERSGYALENTNTAARQAKRELRKATRGMTEEQAFEAITASDELSDLMTVSQRKPGNKTGPRPQGMSNYQMEKRAHQEMNGIQLSEPKPKKHEKNIDGLARKAMRTRQEHAHGVDVVAALLKMKGALGDEWSFRAEAPDSKISTGAKNGHEKLRSVFEAIKGIPSLPKSALSQSGESIVLQRNGDRRDIVSIPCLTDRNQQHRGAGRQLSRQESEGIAEKIGKHPTELVEEYLERFGLKGME